MADPRNNRSWRSRRRQTALSDERISEKPSAGSSPLYVAPHFNHRLICGLLSGTADHNNSAVDLCFNGGVVSGSVPESYRGYIEDMRSSFTMLDGSIAALNVEMEDGDSLDSVRLKAIFYSLFFGEASPSRLEHRKFAECFVAYEERSRTITNNDARPAEETYTVAVPIRECPGIRKYYFSDGMTITAGIKPMPRKSITVCFTATGSPYGDEFDQWSNSLPFPLRRSSAWTVSVLRWEGIGKA
jgi:hypothetical protein